MSATVSVKLITGCARCHGDHHGPLAFSELIHPVDCGGKLFTHWALCPNTAQPILMRVAEPPL